ncbi:gustatory receptor 5a for trehalose-like [Papilio machaon]|uniref:gustatory receptor 5a for trehalose-like n=1 Tax=Papilio machaon TaxID=76193 RepID=UPI001E665CB0|nr:gustatory receptor 5a for trehalose-like [Papilio machaon]
MPFIFNITNYSLWKAVPFVVVNVQATFLWNITDVMIMCISIYLTAYLQDLNKIIYDNEKSKSVRWEEIRLLYSHLVSLVKEVDSRFCYLVLLSFFINLFFISLQLFNSLTVLHLTYYIYSFTFLMTRASVMCLLAANVYRAAQEPLFVIEHVPASEYTLEIQRFIRQIRYTTTALSGVYFYVTRSTLLKVVGTLLTYELVLLQFNINIYKGST